MSEIIVREKLTDVEYSIWKYLEGEGKNKGRHPDERYASFDYCYNYFYSFYQENKIPNLADKTNIQMSCLQLGFYLASCYTYDFLDGETNIVYTKVKLVDMCGFIAGQ